AIRDITGKQDLGFGCTEYSHGVAFRLFGAEQAAYELPFGAARHLAWGALLARDDRAGGLEEFCELVSVCFELFLGRTAESVGWY
ncbi:hypothetical protein, partial [Bacillus sp. SIMBA_033]|uniref:hypothetical protein n=1 Tax=Bacillus sp. SIMBA_033 TaxID=3085776 RepID=UPI00397E2D2E